MTKSKSIICPQCGARVKDYQNPAPTVDIVISCLNENRKSGIILIRRKNPPLGFALPGGFIDYGETAEHAAVREAFEETGLKIKLNGLIGVYSDPERDSRRHTLSIAYHAEAAGTPKPGDDAAEVLIFQKDEIPDRLCFDHSRILADYFNLPARKK